ncbi:hypothetical protein JXB22_04825 [candidate division WOR-3 bacterium]|nr:hypothetical protein [candidate division WOR-3 bacterium]
MKKTTLFALLLPVIVICVFAGSSLLRTGGITIDLLTYGISEEQKCFDASYAVVSDSMMFFFDSLFDDMGIRHEPFLHVLYYIQMFDALTDTVVRECIPLNEILRRGASNTKSNALAISVLMQSAGWDVLCFYNDDECYLGINLGDDWSVRKGNWVEKDDKKYYLKEFDMSTPAGSLLIDDPASQYFSVSRKNNGLYPLPCICSLPAFSGESLVKKMTWLYHDRMYSVLVMIPEEQLRWTQNLPPSLYGMACAGMVEMQNMGLVEQLKAVIDTMSEYDGVNCLCKFCQSEDIFFYDKTLPIKSVSQQIIDGRNDCDGRSVVLYALLRTIMEYGKNEVVFLSWPNHIALGVKTRTAETFQHLFDRNAFSIDDFFVLDAAYAGDTEWGDKIPRLADTCEIIR